MSTLTTIPGLPVAVERRVAVGRKLRIPEIAGEVHCSEWAVRYYLRRVGLMGPVKPRGGRPRRGRRTAEERYLPTSDEIWGPGEKGEVSGLAREIRMENLAAKAARAYRWPDRRRYEVKIYRDPRMEIG